VKRVSTVERFISPPEPGVRFRGCSRKIEYPLPSGGALRRLL
jgi:hypothetical protein